MGPAVQNVLLLLLMVLSLTTLTAATQTDFTVDLRTAVTSPVPDGVTGISWHSLGADGHRCNIQGVFGLTFSPQRKRAEIIMTFEESYGFSFNVADSITMGNDHPTQGNHSGVHSLAESLFFYAPGDHPAGSYGYLHTEDYYVASNTTITINVTEQLVTVDNGHRCLYINSDNLFARDRQRDRSPSGVIYDVFVGMNRMAYIFSDLDWQGHGLCKVTIRFHPE